MHPPCTIIKTSNVIHIAHACTAVDPQMHPRYTHTKGLITSQLSSLKPPIVPKSTSRLGPISAPNKVYMPVLIHMLFETPK